jgi:hypothetical protein
MTPPLYSLKPSFLNLFHEAVHARARRADHFRERLLNRRHISNREADTKDSTGSIWSDHSSHKVTLTATSGTSGRVRLISR